MFLIQVVVDSKDVSVFFCFFFFQAEDGIRDLVRSRGLGDVYKRQGYSWVCSETSRCSSMAAFDPDELKKVIAEFNLTGCLLYTSDAADERSSVDLGGRRIIKKKNNDDHRGQ